MTYRSSCRIRMVQMFSVAMTLFLCVSILSASHVELRPIVQGQTTFALDIDHKSTMVKPRPVTSHLRADPLLMAVTLVIFLMQLLSSFILALPKLDRFAHIPLALQRLFLMPVKRTSTAI